MRRHAVTILLIALVVSLGAAIGTAPRAQAASDYDSYIKPTDTLRLHSDNTSYPCQDSQYRRDWTNNWSEWITDAEYWNFGGYAEHQGEFITAWQKANSGGSWVVTEYERYPSDSAREVLPQVVFSPSPMVLTWDHLGVRVAAKDGSQLYRIDIQAFQNEGCSGQVWGPSRPTTFDIGVLPGYMEGELRLFAAGGSIDANYPDGYAGFRLGPDQGGADLTRAETYSAAPCQDVLIVGARGSGQTQGVGAEVWTAITAYSQALPSRMRVGYYGLAYTAYPVETLVIDKPLGDSGVRTYFGGVDEGFHELLQTLNARMSLCPQERVILAGYSQGAMVVHRFLDRWTPSNTRDLARLEAVWLIADPDRTQKEGGTSYGSQVNDSSGDRGITSIFKTDISAWPAKHEAFARSVKDRVSSVCDIYDIVCDAVHLRRLAVGGALGGVAISGGASFRALSSVDQSPASASKCMPGTRTGSP